VSPKVYQTSNVGTPLNGVNLAQFKSQLGLWFRKFQA